MEGQSTESTGAPGVGPEHRGCTGGRTWASLWQRCTGVGPGAPGSDLGKSLAEKCLRITITLKIGLAAVFHPSFSGPNVSNTSERVQRGRVVAEIRRTLSLGNVLRPPLTISPKTRLVSVSSGARAETLGDPEMSNVKM
jgi:hypothetical protein